MELKLRNQISKLYEIIKIQSKVNSEMAIQLADVLEEPVIKKRIENAIKNGIKYRDWYFDGCSCLPDKFLGILTPKNSWTAITYLCCLPHDLWYAYGESKNRQERKQADLMLRHHLIIRAEVKPFVAEIFYRSVRLGGPEWMNLSYSWAFARND